MQGIIYSLIAGIFIAVQGVFNSSASEKMGIWQTNLVVNGLGFGVCLVIFLVVRNGSIGSLTAVNPLYLTGGALGVVIVFSVIKGITLIGASYATALVLLSQLGLAFLLDTVGLFGLTRVPITLPRVMGLLLIAGGVVVFKLK